VDEMKKVVFLTYLILLLILIALLGCAQTPQVQKEGISLKEKDDKIIIEKVSFPSTLEKEVMIPATYYRRTSIIVDKSPAVILIHGAFGLRGFEKNCAKRFCKFNYSVLLPDFFTPRKIDHLSLAAGMRREETREHGKKWVEDTFAAIEYMEKRGIEASQIVLLGWSVGGAIALLSASEYEKNLRAAIAYYSPCNDAQSRLAKTKIPLLIIQAENEDSPFSSKKDCIPQYEMLQKLQLPIEFYVLKGAYHSFDNPEAPSTPQPQYGIANQYSRHATEEAWRITLDFLERCFKQKRGG
jgi:dienelactone hydrolase